MATKPTKKTMNITLGGSTYSIPQLDMSQLHRMTAGLEWPSSQRLDCKLLEIALEHATPEFDGDQGVTFNEVHAAVNSILAAHGLRRREHASA